jgi:hypothetical protein
METPLASSLLKIERSYQQLKQLESTVRAFLDTKPYSVTVEFNRESGIVVARAKVREECPPIWSVLVGELLHNLRSSLDYIVWELVILETGDAPTTIKTQFPIFRYESAYNKRAKEFLHGVGMKELAVIKSLQPFSTGEDVLSPLWYLHELSNWDKHRALHFAGATLQDVHIVLPPTDTDGGRIELVEVSAPWPFEDGFSSRKSHISFLPFPT